MRSFTHSLVQKAHRYSQEPDRIRFRGFSVVVAGDNASHVVGFDGERLACDCDHSQHEGICAHVVAFEKMFRVHLPGSSVELPYPAAAGSP